MHFIYPSQPLERREPIPSSIHACQSKRRLVREEPSEEERKRVEGPNITPFRHSVAEPARLEAVALWENWDSFRGENDQCAAPLLCQGLRYGRGQGGLIAHVVRRLLPD
jgi:hypothetical protein